MRDEPQTKVAKALHQTARVQSTVADPRVKIEAATWQMFFELPLQKLLDIRERALNRAQPPYPTAEDEMGLLATETTGGGR